MACDAHDRAYACKVVHTGLHTTVDVDPGLVFRNAQLLGARNIVVMHNHPSGDPSPSVADVRLTIRLITGGDIISCQVLDHIILAQSGGHLSMRAHHPHLWPRH